MRKKAGIVDDDSEDEDPWAADKESDGDVDSNPEMDETKGD